MKRNIFVTVLLLFLGLGYACEQDFFTMEKDAFYNQLATYLG